MLESGIEVVFFGSDAGEEVVREIKMPQHFARSMSLADAMNPNNLLCYEMNGAPLPPRQRIPAAADRAGLVRHRQRQVAAAHRGAGHALHEPLHGARLRHHPRGAARRGGGLDGNLRRAQPCSSPRPPRSRGTTGSYRIIGAAWGAPIARVEVQIDDGPWLPADHRRQRRRRVRLEDLVAGLGGSGAGRAHHHLAGDRQERTDPAGHGRPAHRQQAHLLGEQRPGDSGRCLSPDRAGRPKSRINEGETQCPAIWSNALFPTG